MKPSLSVMCISLLSATALVCQYPQNSSGKEIGRLEALKGSIYLLTSAPSGKTSDGERIVRLNPKDGTRSTVFVSNEPYAPDESTRRVVGYIPERKAILFKVRDPARRNSDLLVLDAEGKTSNLATFENKWISFATPVESSVAVVLSDKRALWGRPPFGTEVFLVRINGGKTELIKDVPISGEVTCSSQGTCCVPILDSESVCKNGSCGNMIILVKDGKTFPQERARGSSPHLSPDGRLVAMVDVAEEASRFRLFDLEAGQWVSSLGDSPVAGAAWSPDGNYFVHGSGGAPPTWMLRIWDKSGSQAAQYEIPYRSRILGWAD